MGFIETVPKPEATGILKEIYNAAEASSGYIPNYAQLFSHRSEVYKAWQALSAAVRKKPAPAPLRTGHTASRFSNIQQPLMIAISERAGFGKVLIDLRRQKRE